MFLFKKQNNLVLLYKYMYYYFIVFIIPLGVVIFLYIDIYNSTLKTAYENGLNNLEKSCSIVESYLTSIDELTYQLDVNYFVNQYIQAGVPYIDKTIVSEVTRLKPMLLSFLTTNNYINEIQIYSQKSQSMITSSASFLRLDMLFDERFNGLYESLEQWQREYLNKVYKSSFYLNYPATKSARGSLTYIKTLTRSNSSSISNIYVLLNNQMLLDVMETTSGVETGFALMCDDNGNYITNSDINSDELSALLSLCKDKKGYYITTHGKERMLITYYKSNRLKGYYITAVSEQYILQGLSGVRIVLFVIVAVSILLGLVLIVLFAIKSSRPIVNLVDMMEKNQLLENINYSDEFVNREVLKVVQNSIELKQRAINQIPTIKLSLLHKLLSGNVSNMDGLLEDFLQLGISISGSYYAILILTINEISTESKVDEICTYHAIISDYIIKLLDNTIGIYDIDLSSMAVIISTNDKDHIGFAAQLEQYIPKIKRYALTELGLNISLSGSITDSVTKIYKCFQEAKTASEYTHNINHMEILWYSKARLRDNKFFVYPVDLETELIEYIKNSDVSNCQRILDEIYKFNIKELAIPYATAIQLFHALNATLFRIASRDNTLTDEISITIEQLPKYINGIIDINDGFRYISSLIIRVCEACGANHKINLIQSILAYIDMNFTDNQLSLGTVAKYFDITEIYLSRYFKEKTGENFSKYVERLRMEKARELLTKDDNTIAEVALAVGYNSAPVFRRVYKKNYNELPSKHI